MTTVLIADDQELVRAGFRMVLEHHGLRVVGEAADGVQAVEAAARLRPAVVLMDLRMPRLDGIEATRAVVAAAARDGSPTRVLVLTTFDLDEHVVDAVRAGASGFLLKDVAPEDLAHAVRVVARGEAMLAPALTRRLLERFAGRPPGGRPAALAGLSEREVDVVRLVARGLSNAEIAAELVLGETTVKTYLSRVLGKLGLRDRVQVAVLAYDTGLVQPGG